jgi:hypothetical protein
MKIDKNHSLKNLRFGCVIRENWRVGKDLRCCWRIDFKIDKNQPQENLKFVLVRGKRCGLEKTLGPMTDHLGL